MTKNKSDSTEKTVFDTIPGFLSADQVNNLEVLAAQYKFNTKSIGLLIGLAAHEYQRRELMQDRAVMQALIQSADWKDLIKSIRCLKTQIQAFMYLPNAKLPELTAMPEELQTSMPAPDRDFTEKFLLQCRLKYGFSITEYPDMFLSSDILGAKEMYQTSFVARRLISLEQVLADAIAALELPDKRGRGAPAKEQNRRFFSAIKDLCTSNDIKPSRAPGSRFVSFLKQYLNILGISKPSAESMATHYLPKRSAAQAGKN